MALQSVFIRLNDEEEVKTYEEFKDVVKQNHSDTTKMTKALWAEYVAKNKKGV